MSFIMYWLSEVFCEIIVFDLKYKLKLNDLMVFGISFSFIKLSISKDYDLVLVKLILYFFWSIVYNRAKVYIHQNYHNVVIIDQ